LLKKLTGFLSVQPFGRQQNVIGEDVEVAITIRTEVGDDKIGGIRTTFRTVAAVKL
jgi:hypothetical protein